MNSVDISVQGVKMPAWCQAVEKFVQSVLNEIDKDSWNVSILFCSADFMRQMNKMYRGKDESTDVLSFAQGDDAADVDGIFYAGDILISLENLAENAQRFSVTQNEELQRLLIHGILHLAGMDHQTNEPSEAMLIKQEEILKDIFCTLIA
ncbi:MAG: rRNA maturation RNase YbeY [Termitinemataceae bacterium]|nr:MAG: rRNA maturation RNase YbeY [Termitinemataceae bacterium]